MAIDTESVAIKPQTGYWHRETHHVNTTCARGLHVWRWTLPQGRRSTVFQSWRPLWKSFARMAVILCVFKTVRLLKTITENDSVRRIPWIRLTLKSFGTRTTALDVSTMTKQGIVARGWDQISVVSQWDAKQKLLHLMIGEFVSKCSSLWSCLRFCYNI